MNLRIAPPAELIDRLGWTLIHSLWQGLLAVGVLMLVRAMLRRRSPQARYLASMGMLGAIVIGCVVTFVKMQPMARPDSNPALPSAAASLAPTTPSNSRRDPIAGATDGNDSKRTHSSEISATASGPGPIGVTRGNRFSAAVPAANLAIAASRRIQPVLPWLDVVWLGGVLLLGIWRIGGWMAVQRLRVLKVVPADVDISAAADRLARRMGLRRPVRIMQSLLAQTPMVIGWLRPVILIPAGILSGLTRAQFEGILAHELAHIRRHDYLVNLVQVLAETLLFYHPAVWWISRQIRLEREQQCDDIALEICQDRCMYAQSLARLEEWRLGGGLAMAATGGGGGQMLTRIRRLLAVPDDTTNWGTRTLLTIAILLLAGVVLLAQENPSGNAGPAQGAQTRPAESARSSAAQAARSARGASAASRARLAPYSAVRWADETPQILVNGVWYEFTGIDGIPAKNYVDYLNSRFGDPINSRGSQFAIRLMEWMSSVGHVPGNNVTLQVRTLDTHRDVTLSDIPLTQENYAAIMGLPADPKNGTATVFSDVRSKDTPIQVLVGPTWYELLSVDGLSAAKIHDFATQLYGDAWQDGLKDHSVVVITRMGDLSASAALKLRTLDTGTEVSIYKLVLRIGETSIHRAPFTAIRWVQEVPQVQVNSKWYQLDGIDGIPAKKLVEAAKNKYGLLPGVPIDLYRQFSEDLVSMLTAAGQSPGATAQLQLQTLDTHESLTLNNIPMTAENLTHVVNGDSSEAFGAITWGDNKARVEIDNTWYELISITIEPRIPGLFDPSNPRGLQVLPADQIFENARKAFGDSWQQMIQHNLVQAMGLPNQGLTPIVLQLRPEGFNQEVSLYVMLYPNRAAAPRGAVQPATRPEPPDDSRAAVMPSIALAQASAATRAASPPSPSASGGDAQNPPYLVDDGYPKLAPFTAIRWNSQIPEVQIESKWYALLSVNGIAVSDILGFLKGDELAAKHFAEDLVEVMTRMGHKPGDSVTLQVKTLDTQQTVTMPNVAMTAENRQAVLVSDGERGMPFSAIRWHGAVPEIYIDSHWYELTAINGSPVDKIVTFAQGWAGAEDWPRRFAEDLPQILSAMGQLPGPINLDVRSLDTHQPATLKDVSTVADNRDLNMFGIVRNGPALSDFQNSGTLTFFSGVQWKNDVAQVQINGNPAWYDLVGISRVSMRQRYDFAKWFDQSDSGEISAKQIYDFARGRYGDRWQQEITDHSVEVLNAIQPKGRDNTDDVMLRLHAVDTDENVAMLKRVWRPMPKNMANLVPNSKPRFKFFIYGDFDLAGTGKPNSADRQKIEDYITRGGGTIQASVDASTDFVLLGARPTPTPTDINALQKYADVIQQAQQFNLLAMDQRLFMLYFGQVK